VDDEIRCRPQQAAVSDPWLTAFQWQPFHGLTRIDALQQVDFATVACPVLGTRYEIIDRAPIQFEMACLTPGHEGCTHVIAHPGGFITGTRSFVSLQREQATMNRF
jgi:hypothetical protein